MNLAPIVLFTYNRPDHTRETITALQANELASSSDLFIYSDAPKNPETEEAVKAVRQYLQTITGFKNIKIIAREHNWGLADSIVDGVTQLVNEYGKVIVLEDDIVTSPYFLTYMNEALELYKDEEKVMHVSGYFYPIDATHLPSTFFYNQTSCWGWGTWARAWCHYRGDAKILLDEILAAGRLKEFDMDGKFRFSSTLKANITGKVKTWAIKWQASVFLKEGLSLHPNQSLVKNVGLDNSGVNSGNNKEFTSELTNQNKPVVTKVDITENKKARDLASNFLATMAPKFTTKVFSYLSNLIRK